MKTNVAVMEKPVFTHEGAKAVGHLSPEAMLRRSLICFMLFEDSFYEDGLSIAARIAALVPKVAPEKVAAMAVEAREKMKLRHAPLFIVREMARHKTHRGLVSETLATVIQRADELAEFIAIYWKDAKDEAGKEPLSAGVKKGLAKAFRKFDEYALGKYNRDAAIKLRDVLFMCHAKPKDNEQAALWKRLVDGMLATPDTWEVALSASGGEDKGGKWTDLLVNGKMGALAILRNLRNFDETKVARPVVKEALKTAKVDRVLPYRFIAAARYAPWLEPELETLMFKAVEGHARLLGKTLLLIDVSGSMSAALSAKSEMLRIDAACGLAVLAREVCDEVEVVTFSNQMALVPSRRGFALRDAIKNSQPHSGTYLGRAIAAVNSKMEFDRIIVFTDEQSADSVGEAKCSKAYMVNVASYEFAVGFGKWNRITGFSEAILDFIIQLESQDDTAR